MRKTIQKQKGFIDNMSVTQASIDERSKQMHDEKTILQQQVKTLEKEKAKADKKVVKLIEKIKGIYNCNKFY